MLIAALGIGICLGIIHEWRGDEIKSLKAKLDKAEIAVLDMMRQWVLRDLTYEDFRKVLLELEKTE